MTPDQRNYDGPATLVSGTDEIPVTAELRIESEPVDRVDDNGWMVTDGVLYSWGGSISSEDRRLVTVIGRACDIRIPDAGTGRVRVPGGSYDMDQPPTTPVLAEVRGEGRAPWLGDE